MHFKCTRIAEALAKSHNCTINPDVICLLTELVFRYHQVLATDLECFAKHAKRTTITVDDVLCFARRNPQLVQALNTHRQNQQQQQPQPNAQSSHAATKKSAINSKSAGLPSVMIKPKTSDDNVPMETPRTDEDLLIKCTSTPPDAVQAESLTDWFVDLE
ncbi:unnamed protein product [Echinostoma caproni]|uniref:Centromere protein S n=1 Tax=Echinostoma caproni TaxID=27848 RepID=A0A3P8L8E7_9TREM|nr:unnamed protein product [Echinostoma caproni]